MIVTVAVGAGQDDAAEIGATMVEAGGAGRLVGATGTTVVMQEVVVQMLDVT